jgi:hypothetical protein
MPDLITLPWRQGRHVGRHLYAQIGPVPSDDDPVIGTLDTAGLAAEACESHNAALAARRAQERAARPGAGRMTGLTGVQIGDGNSQNNVF